MPKVSKMGSQMGSVWMLLAHFFRSFFEASKKDPPGNLARPTCRYLASPGGAQRRHLAKAKWLSNLAKAKLLRTENWFTRTKD